MKTFIIKTLFLLNIITFSPVFAKKEAVVVGILSNQLGNNMFQIATTCAHAWDHNAEPIFPDLLTRDDNGMPVNYEHVFFRFDPRKPKKKVTYEWTLPNAYNFSYYPIPYKAGMSIHGNFQNEKYFKHHRERLLPLFAPKEEDLLYIQNKYADILAHPNVVGVQIRWFGVLKDQPWWSYLAQYGYDFFSKAMDLFPEDTLFIVTTNDLTFAKANLPEGKNIIFLENEPYYIDFFLLSMCKHNIITNSTFGWWAAWLNKNPDKIVVAPKNWVDANLSMTNPYDHIWPDEWIRIDAKWGKPQDPIDSFR